MSKIKDRKAPPQSKGTTSETWSKVPWKKLEQHCFRIQKRIYRANQRGNQRAVQKLQKLLMKSEAARMLAVRRVTQENQGKKTAGIDGVKSVQTKGGLRSAAMISGGRVIQRGPRGVERTLSRMPAWHQAAMVETLTLSRSAAARAE